MEAQSNSLPPTTQQATFSGPLQTGRDLDPLLERIGDAHYVLLGEASHGTHEYYTWRAAITKRLITEKGFSFVAVEGDWPACYRINRYVKDYPMAAPTAPEVLDEFRRWPTWMWANWEVAALMDWLKDHNQAQAEDRKVGFFGLDVYSLWESMEALAVVLQRQDPATARLAREAMACFEPYGPEGKDYARAIAEGVPASCREEVMDLLEEVRCKAPSYDHEPEAALNAEMNAWVAVDAERYYTSMLGFHSDSWNIRDTHMTDTINRLMQFHGPQARCIVWEHNTHIGDARFTAMQQQGRLNVGQLVREQHTERDVVLVGFGSYQGTVIAGPHWGGPMQIMPVPPARPSSVEAILHGEGAENKLLIFNAGNPNDRFQQTLGHRAIGVVYDPGFDALGNYVPTVLARRYDAFLYLDRTRALHPLDNHPDDYIIPDTYPFSF
jgi:erythromycin esterase-like protein